MKLTTPLTKAAAVVLVGPLVVLAAARPPFIDPESLPTEPIFKGPWETFNKAPADKTRITPSRIWDVEGNITTSLRTVKVGAAAAGAFDHGITIGPGGVLTLEFEENIAGRYDPRRLPVKPQFH